ncbi:MAG: NAD(P)/FAD-dependent oxidoreductase [Microbacteriaceae bacterium]|nr:NAD(P)/FAD-dependent oxidoreductase [Microbacteriaceae bacterium]
MNAAASSLPDPEVIYDVAIIGAGPAGLSAGLNLVRAKRGVVVIDSNRPRHAATMLSHGFLTRDATPPGELRKLAREEYLSYPEANYLLGEVLSVEELEEAPVVEQSVPGHSFGTVGLYKVNTRGINGNPDTEIRARAVLVCTGLKETLPNLPSIRSFYGMGLFSCVQCDGYEYADKPIALIGDTDDLAWRAMLIAQWSSQLVVFTNGADVISQGQETLLAERGVRIERRKIVDVEGGREGPTGIRVLAGAGAEAASKDAKSASEGTEAASEVVPITGGFVRPHWSAQAAFLDGFDLERDGWGLLKVDSAGRTSHAGIYAAGDVTSPGPQQLIVAAGAGAKAAATINRDLIGVPTASTRH